MTRFFLSLAATALLTSMNAVAADAGQPLADASMDIAAESARKIPDAALERAYWLCIDADAKAFDAKQGMDDQLLAGCTTVSKELQQRKFGDDFAQLHAWTQAQKPQRLATLAKR